MFVINPRLFYAFALLALIVAQFDPKDATLSVDQRPGLCVEAPAVIDIDTSVPTSPATS